MTTAAKIEAALQEDTWEALIAGVRSTLGDLPNGFLYHELLERVAQHLGVAPESLEQTFPSRRSSPYEEYLASPQWRLVREWALERYEHRCGVCNTIRRLQVHHRTYERLGVERPADLVVLCDECHGIFHRHGKLHR